MQGVWNVKGGCAGGSQNGKNQALEQPKCPNARSLHSANILSTMKFVPYAQLGAAHFLLIGGFACGLNPCRE
jgi:hypothetical protein